jgi:hypothetical protein
MLVESGVIVVISGRHGLGAWNIPGPLDRRRQPATPTVYPFAEQKHTEDEDQPKLCKRIVSR